MTRSRFAAAETHSSPPGARHARRCKGIVAASALVDFPEPACARGAPVRADAVNAYAAKVRPLRGVVTCPRYDTPTTTVDGGNQGFVDELARLPEISRVGCLEEGRGVNRVADFENSRSDVRRERGRPLDDAVVE